MKLVDKIRSKHPELGGDAQIGVWASFGKDTTVDTEGGNRDITVVANTDDIDLDNEVVIPSGADRSYFESNRKVFVDHDYTMGSHVGSLRRNGLSAYPSFAEQKGWLARIGMLKISSPVPDDILSVAREVGIGVSIGFAATDVGPPTEDEAKRYEGKRGAPASIVRAWDWIELSFTAMPCNVSCQSRVEVLDDTRAASLEALVTKGKIQKASARALGLPDRSLFPAAESPIARKTYIHAGLGAITKVCT